MTAAEAIAQEVVEDAPPLENMDDTPAADDAEMAQRGGKQAKRYAKAMAKMGLKPEPNITRVQIRKHQGLSFAINRPEVYRFPGTNTFVIFGETQLEEAGSDAQKAAARTVVGQDKPETAATAAAAGADDDDEDPAGLQDKEINVVMTQANVSRGKAIRALKNNNGDIVNAIMELTM